MKYRTILLFGAPGAGKGTQGKILGTIPRFFHCACGDVFRNLTIESPIGRTFVEYSSRGELVPDKQTVELWQQSIESNQKTGRFHPDQDTLVLDGIPRNVHQAEMLKDTLNVVAIFYLRSKDENNLVLRIQRRALKENRLDDASLDVIRQRLKTYENETKPVLNYYGENLVHHIDADEAPSAVVYNILKHVLKVPEEQVA
jgi:adenylate kinase